MTQLTERFDEALVYARRLHADQVRKGTEIPYVSHLLGVASLVLEAGGDEDEAIAALLHDAVEDQGGEPTLAEIRQRFGPHVADIVAGCTDAWEEPKPPWIERKRAYIEHLEEASPSALLVSCADKLHNVRSIISDYLEIGEAVWERFSADPDEILWYYQTLADRFEDLASDARTRCLVTLLDSELAELEALMVMEEEVGANWPEDETGADDWLDDEETEEPWPDEEAPLFESEAFTPEMARRLSAFLDPRSESGSGMSYRNAAGFLFAVASSPEPIQPSEWLPLILGQEEGGALDLDLDEFKGVMNDIMALYNEVNRGVFEGEPIFPPGCEPDADTMRNLEPGAPLSEWVRGFITGHMWLEEVWDEYVPEEMQDELSALLMVMTFFSGREAAQAFWEDSERKQSLEEMTELMLDMLPRSMTDYASMGRVIAEAIREVEEAERQPVRRQKIGRNEPCPCGSGKKYKKCCGARVH